MQENGTERIKDSQQRVRERERLSCWAATKSRAPNANWKCVEAIFDKSLAKRKSRINRASSACNTFLLFYFLPSSSLEVFFSSIEISEQWRLCLWCVCATLCERNLKPVVNRVAKLAAMQFAPIISSSSLRSSNKFRFDEQITAEQKNRIFGPSMRCIRCSASEQVCERWAREKGTFKSCSSLNFYHFTNLFMCISFTAITFTISHLCRAFVYGRF